MRFRPQTPQPATRPDASGCDGSGLARYGESLDRRIRRVRETADALRLKEFLVAQFAGDPIARHLTPDEHLLISQGDVRAVAIGLLDRLAKEWPGIWTKVLAAAAMDADMQERRE